MLMNIKEYILVLFFNIEFNSPVSLTVLYLCISFTFAAIVEILLWEDRALATITFAFSLQLSFSLFSYSTFRENSLSQKQFGQNELIAAANSSHTAAINHISPNAFLESVTDTIVEDTTWELNYFTSKRRRL